MKHYSFPISKDQVLWHFGRLEPEYFCFRLVGKEFEMYIRINQRPSQILLNACEQAWANSREGEGHSVLFATSESVLQLDDLQCGNF
jgi:hypothetical protein